MKLSQCVEAVHTCIRLHPETNFHYFENVGTGEEFYTSDRKQIQRKIFPYFFPYDHPIVSKLPDFSFCYYTKIYLLLFST